MKIRDKLKSVSKKQALLIAGGVIVLGGSAFALTPNSPLKADEQTPLGTQVQEHEGRIGDLEDGLNETNDKVNQNSADISAVQRETGVAPAPAVPKSTPTQSGGSTTPSTPAPTPTPAPAPINPWTITAVSEYPHNATSHKCDYTVYDSVINKQIGVYIQPISQPCQQVGNVLVRG